MGRNMRTITISILSLFFFTTLSGQITDSSLKISHLTGDFYIFTTYNMYNNMRIPANGMYVVTNSGVIMIDTPWDTTQFQPLLDSIQVKHHKNVVLCVATHFHEDRTGGLEYYRKQGIKTYTTRQTDELSKKRGMKRAEFLMNKDTVFTLGQYSFQTFYPGQGHTKDNIVIWFDKEKVLYGGCLVKSTVYDDLGNLKDANVKEYATTIEHVQKRFLHPKYIIPGHQDWTNTESLNHTLIMAQQAQLSPR
jgi:metallo-beta-lactamase class B